MRRLIIVLAGLSLAQPAAAQSPEVQARLVAARDTIWRAWFAHDTALLKRFLPPAAASVEGSGKGWNNREKIVQGSRGFVQSKSRLVDIKFENTQISQAGHSALVRSDYQTIVETSGKRDTTRGRATELFVLIGNTWVNPYWQLEPGAGADGGREIFLPDTLGANYAIADSTKMLGTLTDYDALLGVWEFRFQGRRPDGTFWPPFTGHWTFEKKPGGGLIEDRWRPDDPSISMGISLYTYRLFDPQKKVWAIIGTSSNGGGVQPGWTWSDAKSRYVIQRDGSGKILSRIRYLSISDDHFLWRSDRSLDGGKTWIRDFGIMEATRIGK